MRFVFLLAAALLSGPAVAQSNGPLVFDPLTTPIFDGTDVYSLDADFAAEHDVAVPAPSDLTLPRHEGLHVRIIPTPVGRDVLAVEFSQITADPDDLIFLESLQITDAAIPMMADQDDPTQARVLEAAGLLQQAFLPAWLQAFPETEVLGMQQTAFGNAAAAVEILLAYRDSRQSANMLTRVVVLLHPDQPESLLVTANIDLDQVPVTDAETLAATLTGRVLSQWRFR